MLFRSLEISPKISFYSGLSPDDFGISLTEDVDDEILPFVNRSSAIIKFLIVQQRNYVLARKSSANETDRQCLLVADHMFGAGKTYFGRKLITKLVAMHSNAKNPEYPDDKHWQEVHKFMIEKEKEIEWKDILKKLHCTTYVRILKASVSYLERCSIEQVYESQC